MGCGGGFMKWFLVGLNGLFCLLGIALIGIGGYVMIEVNEYSALTSDSFDAIPIAIMVFGGEIKSVLQTIVVIAEIIAGILGFVKKDEVAELLGGVAEESMVLWNCTGSECNDVALAWDSIQRSFDCCGVGEYDTSVGYKDWSNATISEPFLDYATKRGWNSTGSGPMDVEYPVTDSCCKDYDSGDSLDCGLQYVNLDQIYTTGCVQGLENWIVDNIEIIAGAAVGIAVIQLVCILFACYFQKDLYG